MIGDFWLFCISNNYYSFVLKPCQKHSPHRNLLCNAWCDFCQLVRTIIRTDILRSGFCLKFAMSESTVRIMLIRLAWCAWVRKIEKSILKHSWSKLWNGWELVRSVANFFCNKLSHICSTVNYHCAANMWYIYVIYKLNFHVQNWKLVPIKLTTVQIWSRTVENLRTW